MSEFNPTSYEKKKAFVVKMAKAGSHDRFKIRTSSNWNAEEGDCRTQYSLEEVGTGSSWKGNKAFNIPWEYGQILESQWKRNGTYGAYIGQWGAKKVLKALENIAEADDFDADFVKSIQEEVALIAADNERARLQRIKNNRIVELEKAARTLVEKIQKANESGLEVTWVVAVEGGPKFEVGGNAINSFEELYTGDVLEKSFEQKTEPSRW